MEMETALHQIATSLHCATEAYMSLGFLYT